MKAILSAVAFLFALCVPLAAQATVGDPASAICAATTQSTVAGAALAHPVAFVPTGETYRFYKNGVMVGSVAGGHRWSGLRGLNVSGLNCVKIPCPTTFDPSTTCWECK